MKKALIIITAALFTLAACDKNEPLPAVITPVDSTAQFDSSYVIAGVVDIKMDNIDSNGTPLSINHITGVQKKITLSVTGLPANATVTFAPASGIAPFGTLMSIQTTFAAAGTYPVKLVATPESGTANEYEFTLTVEPEKDCNNYFYTSIESDLEVFASTSSEPYDMSSNDFYYDEQTKELYIRGELPLREPPQFTVSAYKLRATNESEYLKLSADCSNGTINIPSQTVNGFNIQAGSQDFTVSGTGKILLAEERFEITYSSFSKTDNVTTTYTLKGGFTP